MSQSATVSRTKQTSLEQPVRDFHTGIDVLAACIVYLFFLWATLSHALVA